MKFLLVIAVLIAVAWFYFKPLPPGKGPNAEAGMRSAARVMQAIESYHSARGLYPAGMTDMIPEYLTGVPHLSNGSTFEYERLGARYKLTFNYTNPLPVHCSYESGKRWECEWF
jgi:hypothetical protein